MIDRKEQILDVATELLLSRSFTSFSYQDLSDRLGISKASIHHHFATKAALGVAVAARIGSSVTHRLKEVAHTYESPWDRFEGYVAVMSEIMQSGNKICLPGSLQAEHNVIPEGMQAEVSGLYRYLQTWLTKVLTEGREQGQIEFPGSPQDQATLIRAAIQGALQNARAEGPKEFTTVVRQLRAGMKATV